MEELAKTAEGTEPDGSIWLAVNGGTLHPLLRVGDSACFTPCGTAAVRAGDVVLVRRASVWMVRLVVDGPPPVTALMRGPVSEEYGVVHARLTGYSRAGRKRAFGRAGRRRALLLRRILGTDIVARMSGSHMLHRLRRLPTDLATHPLLRRIRTRRAGAIHVRLLGPDDAAALEQFARAWLPHLAELLQKQLTQRWQVYGMAFGAFTTSGDMVGFVFLDEYAQESVELPGMWVRALKVVPHAQRLGVGRRLMAALIEGARVRGITSIYADIHATNDASLRLFRELLFRDGGADLTSKLHAEFGDAESRRMVVVVRDV